MRVLSLRGPHFRKIPVHIITSEPVVLLQSLLIVFAVLWLLPFGCGPVRCSLSSVSKGGNRVFHAHLSVGTHIARCSHFVNYDVTPALTNDVKMLYSTLPIYYLHILFGDHQRQ